MALPIGAVLAVLLAAVLHASWNALLKREGDRLVGLCLVLATPGLACAAALPFLPLPRAEAWPFLLASLAIHLVYYATLLTAYRHGDLSQVYPIARGTAPLLVAALAWRTEGETLNGIEIAGLLVLTAGIVGISGVLARQNRGRITTPALLFALANALTIAAYSVADGMGVRRAGDAIGYICWLFAIQPPLLVAFMFWRRRGRAWSLLREQAPRGIAGGVLAGLAYGIAVWAMGRGYLAHVVALRETSVLAAAVLGTVVLGEPFGRNRITAAVTIAAGVTLLQLGGAR